MNPRLALVLVLALIVVLVFVGFLLERRRAVRKREMEDLRDRVIDLELLVDDVKGVASKGTGLDVTAEQIMVLLQKHQQQNHLGEIE